MTIEAAHSNEIDRLGAGRQNPILLTGGGQPGRRCARAVRFVRIGRSQHPYVAGGRDSPRHDHSRHTETRPRLRIDELPRSLALLRFPGGVRVARCARAVRVARIALRPAVRIYAVDMIDGAASLSSIGIRQAQGEPVEDAQCEE